MELHPVPHANPSRKCSQHKCRSTLRIKVEWHRQLLIVTAAELLLSTLLANALSYTAPSSTFDENYFVNWGPHNVWQENGGQVMNLKLNKASGACFQSLHRYRYGYFSMRVKLAAGNTAGVVATFYMSSMSEKKDELDFEFLGNVSGEPWTLQTNIFARGTGGREERIYLWFDPSQDFHTYSILWNYHQIVFYVDSYPIRVYRNTIITNVLYLWDKPMWLFCSLWDGDYWATRGGKDKIDWSSSPFVVSYSEFGISGCQWEDPYPACVASTTEYWWDQYGAWSLGEEDRKRYEWVRQNYVVYEYCKDSKRYPKPFPDCSVPPW